MKSTNRTKSNYFKSNLCSCFYRISRRQQTITKVKVTIINNDNNNASIIYYYKLKFSETKIFQKEFKTLNF